MASSSKCLNYVLCAALADMMAAGAMVTMTMALTMTTMTMATLMMPSMTGMLTPACRQRMRRISTPTAAQGPVKARSALLHHALLLHLSMCRYSLLRLLMSVLSWAMDGSWTAGAGACRERSKATAPAQTAHQQQQAPAEGVPVAQEPGRWGLTVHIPRLGHVSHPMASSAMKSVCP